MAATAGTIPIKKPLSKALSPDAAVRRLRRAAGYAPVDDCKQRASSIRISDKGHSSHQMWPRRGRMVRDVGRRCSWSFAGLFNEDRTRNWILE
jgi:hypothetical protein